MKIHFRTVLVSSAALAITGGAAFAYFDATSVSGTGSATTTSVASSLVLTASGANVAVIPGPVDIPVTAANSSTVALRIPSGTTASASAPGCGPENFNISYAPSTSDIPAGATAAPAGAITISFKPLPVPQNACNGATLSFSFIYAPPAPPAP